MSVEKYTKENGWICTDPDQMQFCKKINDNVFIYAEAELITSENGKTSIDPNNYIEDEIDFSLLTDDDIKKSISGYYDSLEEIQKEYQDDWKQIVVECYFEYNNGKY